MILIQEKKKRQRNKYLNILEKKKTKMSQFFSLQCILVIKYYDITCSMIQRDIRTGHDVDREFARTCTTKSSTSTMSHPVLELRTKTDLTFCTSYPILVSIALR